MALKYANNRNKVATAAKAGSVVVNQHEWDVEVSANLDKVYIGDLPAYHELLPELSNLIFDGATGAMTIDVTVEADAAGGFGVASATVTAGGTGYTTAPTVVFAAPPTGGVQATGTAAFATGAVTTVTITNPGSGYLTPPAVSFSGGGGTGASATAALGTNAIFAGAATAAKAFTRVACGTYLLAKTLGVSQVNRAIHLVLNTAPTVAGGQVIAQIASAPIS